jgi:ribonuclease PH
MNAVFVRAQLALQLAEVRLARFLGERGQGTVEYVGLILLVALLMVGMVAAMKGFQGKQGLELAETIVDKIRGAVNKVTFRWRGSRRGGARPPRPRSLLTLSGPMAASRSYDRAPAEIRPTSIEPGFVRTADGSALISQGETRVICTASVTDSVPRWLEGRDRGWVTAEYAMLPASTGERKARDVSRGKQDGRSVEIQRLIGRSLRGVVDFKALGERSVYVDCDVLQADGGTRCAAITGGYVALQLALAAKLQAGELAHLPLNQSVAAISVGMVDGRALCDLDYVEDSAAEVDANVVMTGDGGLVEFQATAERTPLSRASLDELLVQAEDGIARLREAQAQAAGELPG